MLFDQDFKTKFQDIRCYDDSELSAALLALDESGRLAFVFSSVFGSKDVNTQGLLSQNSIEQMQTWLQEELMPEIATSFDGISVEGLEALDDSTPYIFVSNHRDIVMDPLALNIALYQNGFPSSHNAIGDNLLLSQTATRMALVNKCFKISRSVTSPKAMLIALKRQSAYIQEIQGRYTGSVWIAQSEGRALDSIDRTNPALIKMLALARDTDDYAQTIADLNIVPVCLSYEWDPCGLAKARRLTSSTTLTSEQKLAQDKLETLIGIKSHKGRIHVNFGRPLRITDGVKANYAQLCANEIDAQIHSNYRIYPINTAALKLISSKTPTQALTTAETNALKHLSELCKVDLLGSDLSPELHQLLLNYSQPALLKQNTE